MSRIKCYIRGNLIKYTGLSEETVDQMLARDKYPTHVEEWDFWKPNDDASMRFFYTACRSYLFTNATHDFPNELKNPKPGSRILDFGGGVGTIALEFALRGYAVDYYDPSLIQREFVRWVAKKDKLSLHIAAGLHPYDFRPSGTYDLVCAVDVFEHIPGYEEFLKKIVAHMCWGSEIFLEVPFGKSEVGLHIEDRTNLGALLGKLGFIPINERLFRKVK